MNTAISNSALPEPEVDHEYDFSGGTRGSQQQKYSLNLAGEFYVAAELNRRGVFASVTYGATKNADVLAFDQQSRQTAVIQVKTIASPNTKWLTGRISVNEDAMQPHLFWVLVFLSDAEHTSSNPRYFVFTSKELAQKLSGIYSFLLTDAEAMPAEDQWAKITDWLARK